MSDNTDNTTDASTNHGLTQAHGSQTQSWFKAIARAYSPWWQGMRLAFGLKRPGSFYAAFVVSCLMLYGGALLLAVGLRNLGYDLLGTVLGAITLLVLIGFVISFFVSGVRAMMRRVDRDIELQMRHAQQQAEAAYQQKRIRAAAALAAQQEAEERAEWEREQARLLKDANEKTFVYFIVDWQRSAVKIGVSAKPDQRLREVQTGNPHPLELALIVPGGYALERRLHQQYAPIRLRGEWFKLTQELVDLITTR